MMNEHRFKFTFHGVARGKSQDAVARRIERYARRVSRMMRADDHEPGKILGMSIETFIAGYKPSRAGDDDADA